MTQYYEMTTEELVSFKGDESNDQDEREKAHREWMRRSDQLANPSAMKQEQGE